MPAAGEFGMQAHHLLGMAFCGPFTAVQCTFSNHVACSLFQIVSRPVEVGCEVHPAEVIAACDVNLLESHLFLLLNPSREGGAKV